MKKMDAFLGDFLVTGVSPEGRCFAQEPKRLPERRYLTIENIEREKSCLHWYLNLLFSQLSQTFLP